jgi:subtilisin family serine protease
MKFKGALISTVVSMSLAGLCTSVAMAQTLPSGSYERTNIDASQLAEVAGIAQQNKKSSGIYIVQLKSESGVSHQLSLDSSLVNQQAVNLRTAGNIYNARSPQMQAHIAKMKVEQADVLSDLSGVTTLHNYYHTLNGFAAKLNPEQVAALRSNPNVVGLWENEILQLSTANTPEFLGLTGPNGQHSNGVKGEGVIVGVVDSGIWPENPSFLDDGSYNAPPAKWTGACDEGTIGADDDSPPIPDEFGFACNNKLIGARYFGAGFGPDRIAVEFGEFISPRDADGHGSHTAGTAAGNFVENATLRGVEIGSLSGIAPRAHIAAYKVCWNSNYQINGESAGGCSSIDTTAAIDAAVADGVDVINYSISGSLTSVVAPQTLAMLRAADAGVFVAVSAGNSGPSTGVVGTPAPWVMSVAASTYEGSRTVVAESLKVSIDDTEVAQLPSVASTFAPTWNVGFGAAVSPVSDTLACAPLDDDLTGKIALISRGSCAFVTKVLNAQDAGAVGVVVYNNDGEPTIMSGTVPDGFTVTIPALMISEENGNNLVGDALESVTIVTYNIVTSILQETGNVMADFSSRGQNEAVADIIKPDITGPGVNVLASTSAMQFDFPGNNPLQGEDFEYLSGTSMSAPHISGMAALLTQQFPGWTVDQKKSALMTTAYQNVIDFDGAVATPFVFGSGHADVLAARTPGFTYNADAFGYSAYLCGRGADAVVEAFVGFSCGQFAEAGFSFDATQLNYPSIAIAALKGSELVVRTVTDVTGVAQSYDITLDLPAGVEGTVLAFNEQGNLAPTTVLDVPASDFATYGLLLEAGPDAVVEEWAFGAITFTDGDVVNRSPIAVRPIPSVKTIVPERRVVELDRRGRGSFAVQHEYNGRVYMEAKGLASPFGSLSNVSQDADSSFAFNEDGLGVHVIEIPEGPTLVRFSLFDFAIGGSDTDLDLFVYRCIEFSCARVGVSLLTGSNENVEIPNPIPAFGDGGSSFYLAFVHGYDLGGLESVDYQLVYWVVDEQGRNTRMSTSRRAIEGKFNDVRVTGRNLPFFSYMGTTTFFDDEGVNQGMTVVEVLPLLPQ